MHRYVFLVVILVAALFMSTAYAQSGATDPDHPSVPLPLRENQENLSDELNQHLARADDEADESADAGDDYEDEEEDGRFTLTLDELFAIVRARAPQLAIAESDVRQSVLRQREAQLASLPSLRVNFGLAPAPTINVTQVEGYNTIMLNTDRSDLELATGINSVAMRGSLQADLPITTFGKIRLARQLAAIGVDVSELQLQAIEQETVFEAYRAYLVLQWYREVRRLLNEAEGALDEAAEELEWAIDDGDRTARTSLRQLRIARTEFVSLQGEASAAGELARFALENGLDIEEGFRVERLDESMPEDDAPELESVLEFARQHRIDYRLLDDAVAAAEIRARMEWREFAPDIGLIGTINGAYAPSITNLRGPFMNDQYNRFGMGIALGMDWRIHPGRAVASAMRRDEQIVEAEESREGAWIQIELEVMEAYLDATSKQDVLIAFEDALDAAEAWLNQVSFQYDQGLAEFDDFKDPLQTYYRTAAGYYNAILEYRLAVANLALQCGDTDLLTWPSIESNDE